MKKLPVLILSGLLLSCNTTAPLASGEGAASQNSPTKETTSASDTPPAKLSRKAEAAKAAENAGEIQMKPASGSGDLSNPKATKKTTRN